MHSGVSMRTVRIPPRMQATIRRYEKMRPRGERREALVASWGRFQRREWMTEEAARACRRRSLLQDNPASG